MCTPQPYALLTGSLWKDFRVESRLATLTTGGHCGLLLSATGKQVWSLN